MNKMYQVRRKAIITNEMEVAPVVYVHGVYFVPGIALSFAIARVLLL